MENSHDIILVIIIGAIILLQVYVFWGNRRKIRNYKKTIESIKDFGVVEVSVPEEWIKSIDVDEILKNPEAFQNISSEFSSKMTEAPERDQDSDSLFIAEDQLHAEDEEFPGELEFPEDYDDMEYEENSNRK